MRQLGRNLLCALSTGYILFFFSERLFWTVWRPSDSVADLVFTWLAYSAIAYLFLATVSWSRANDFWSVFLTGAVYGWLVEGGLAYTLYGTEASAPFPISISITGLSWHALISVMVGWWATAKALAARRPTALVWISIGVGVFWGLWGMFPRQETPPILTSVTEFFLNSTVLMLGLMAAWWISIWARVWEFQPGWCGLLLSMLAIGTFYVQYVMALGVLPLVTLPILLAVALLALYSHRRRTAPSTMICGTATCHVRTSPVARIQVVALIPLVASATYAVALNLKFDRLPIAMALFFATGAAGFVLLVGAIVMTLSRSSDVSASAPPRRGAVPRG